MGGHGALTIGLKNPDLFKSISAFSPIVAPSLCPWGQKAFSGYLGSDREKWKAYDASQLVSHAAFSGEILIDQGLQDEFLENQLMTQKFLEAAESQENIKVNCNFREGFDHSYYFISSFIDGHLRFHSQRL